MLLVGALEHGEEEVLLAAEIVVEHALVGAGALGDAVDARAAQAVRANSCVAASRMAARVRSASRVGRVAARRVRVARFEARVASGGMAVDINQLVTSAQTGEIRAGSLGRRAPRVNEVDQKLLFPGQDDR